MLRPYLVALTLCCQLSLSIAGALAAGDLDMIRSLENQARESYLKGDVDSCLNSYDQAVQLAQKTYGADSSFLARIYFDEGLVAFKTNQYQKAEECLSHAVRINPNSIQARVKLGEYLNKRGKHAEAREQAQKVLEKHSDSVEARKVLAASYDGEGNVARAIKECAIVGQLKQGAAAPEVVAQGAAAVPIPVPVIAPKAAEPVRVVEPVRVRQAEPVRLRPRREQLSRPVEPAPRRRSLTPRSEAVVSSSPGARLRSKAVLLTPVKSKPKPVVSEEVKADGGEEELFKSSPPKSIETPPPPREPQRQQRRVRNGLIPPPPPMVPSFPAMMMPVQPMAAPPPQMMPAAKPKMKILQPQSPREDHRTDVPRDEENTDFLLDWAGSKKKKSK